MVHKNSIQELSRISKVCFKGVENKIESVNSISKLFAFDKSLISIDLSNFNTQNVESMDSLFEGCNQIKNFKLSSKFITDNIISMEKMFSG